jgi:putative intracellular protease/amidase
MPRILFLVSSARTLNLSDGTPYPTGYWAEEALRPYERFIAAGAEIVVATPDGDLPQADPYGLEPHFHYPDEDEDFLLSVTRTFMPDPEDVRVTMHHLSALNLAASRRIFEALKDAGLSIDEARSRVDQAATISWRENRDLVEVFDAGDLATPLPPGRVRELAEQLWADSAASSKETVRRLAAIAGLSNPINLTELTDDDILAFDALFIPGGQGPMADMADNHEIGRLIRLLHEQDRSIATLCHGPAALLSAGPREDGQWLFDGYRLTSFSNEEEYQTRPGKQPPWYVETALRNAGAVFDGSPSCWASHVVVDRNLITGQNPMSSDATADALLKRLETL